MLFFALILVSLQTSSNAKFFFWSPLEFNIPTLKYFDKNQFNMLRQKLNLTEVIMYESNFHFLSPNLRNLFTNYYSTAFTLNGDIWNLTNVTGIVLTLQIGLFSY